MKNKSEQKQAGTKGTTVKEKISHMGGRQMGQSLVGNHHWQAHAVGASVSVNHGKPSGARVPVPARATVKHKSHCQELMTTGFSQPSYFLRRGRNTATPRIPDALF